MFGKRMDDSLCLAIKLRVSGNTTLNQLLTKPIIITTWHLTFHEQGTLRGGV